MAPLARNHVQEIGTLRFALKQANRLRCFGEDWRFWRFTNHCDQHASVGAEAATHPLF